VQSEHAIGALADDRSDQTQDFVDGRAGQLVGLDGRDVVELAADNPVMIRRSRRTVKLARLPDSSFFKTLRQKLQWMGSHA
jgi:NAD kinase